jgi:hypothetical protein
MLMPMTPLTLGERLELGLNLMYKFGVGLNFDDRLATCHVGGRFLPQERLTAGRNAGG